MRNKRIHDGVGYGVANILRIEKRCPVGSGIANNYHGICIRPVVWLLITLLLGSAAFVMAQGTDGRESDNWYEPQIIDDSTLHPGVASAWAVGHYILASGNVDEAITYLNYAYRTLPDIVLIAMDYQDALARGGYVQDAIKVMDKLIAAHPDSLEWLVRRSSLNLHLGESRKALVDLKVLRKKGHSSLNLLETEALIHASDGDVKKAIEIYRLGLKEYPEQTAELFLGMIQIHQHAHNIAEVLAVCEDAIAVMPKEPVFRGIQMKSLVAMNRHEEALKSAHIADGALLSTGSDKDSFLLSLAEIYVQGGDIDRAIDILSNEDEANGLGLTPSLWLSRLLLGSNMIEEARGLLDKIEQQWPDSPRLWFLRGKLAEENGAWDKAVGHYEQAVNLGRDDPEILLALVRALLVTNDAELARPDHNSISPALLQTLDQYTNSAASVAPDTDYEGQLVLGYAYRALRKFQLAVPHFQYAAVGSSFAKTALTQVSICYDELENTEQALTVLQQLYLDYPDDPEIANSLGYFLAEKNMDLKKAKKLVQFSLNKEPGRGAYLDSMGWIYYRKGNLDDAFDFLIRAVNVLPDDPVILEHLGIVLQEQKQYGQALDVLLRALDSGGEADRLNERIKLIKKQAPAKGN